MAGLRCDCGEALTAECELPESQSIAGLLSAALLYALWKLKAYEEGVQGGG